MSTIQSESLIVILRFGYFFFCDYISSVIIIRFIYGLNLSSGFYISFPTSYLFSLQLNMLFIYEEFVIYKRLIER